MSEPEDQPDDEAEGEPEDTPGPMGVPAPDPVFHIRFRTGIGD